MEWPIVELDYLGVYYVTPEKKLLAYLLVGRKMYNFAVEINVVIKGRPVK